MLHPQWAQYWPQHTAVDRSPSPSARGHGTEPPPAAGATPPPPGFCSGLRAGLTGSPKDSHCASSLSPTDRHTDGLTPASGPSPRNRPASHICQNGHLRKDHRRHVLARMWRKGILEHLAGVGIGTVTAENSTEVLEDKKQNQHRTQQLQCGRYTQRKESRSERYMYANVHRIIYNS